VAKGGSTDKENAEIREFVRALARAAARDYAMSITKK
jgi:hypothetical protein